MQQNTHNCPACGRGFKGIQDYPFVRILSFERLLMPEVMDYTSSAAAERQLALRRSERFDGNSRRRVGIYMTPEIVRACKTPDVAEYLTHLETLPGQDLIPNELLPPLRADQYFKWAYPVVDTSIYLSLTDPEPPTEDRGTAELQVHCEGPNLGSAGGRTLQPLGAIALLCYQGRLAKAFR